MTREPALDPPALDGLARRQADLVSALVCRTPAPAGFDPVGVDRTAATLVRKRWAAVRRHWPTDTAVLLGSRPQAADDFARWAREHAGAGGLPLGGFADGFAFLAWEDERIGLPPACGSELAVARVRHAPAGGTPAGPWVGLTGLRTRRWVGVGIARAGSLRAVAWGRAARPRGVRLTDEGPRGAVAGRGGYFRRSPRTDPPTP